MVTVANANDVTERIENFLYFIIYIFIFILIILPLIIYPICLFKFNTDKTIGFYYMVEAIIIFLLISFGHIYYYFIYDIDLFSTSTYAKLMLTLSLISVPLIYLVGLIYSKVKKESPLSFKNTVIIGLCLAFFLGWLVPLVHKIYYVKRLNQLEERFTDVNSDEMTKDGDIEIALIDSSHDPILRPYRSAPRYYENFLYIKNSSNSTYKGTIFLILYNNNNDKFNIKVLENVEVPAKTTQQLIDDEEENDMLDEWNQYSFKTKQQVKTFDSIVSNN